MENIYRKKRLGEIEMIRRCIYHVPYPITNETKAASAIRPRKMLEAFQDNFGEVFVISGYGKERREKFKKLKKLILSGLKYEFMYSENSTMPNLMTEKNHMPYYPFLERTIFKFCKEHNIPIGLFYRDVYWKFPVYKQKVSFMKRCITLPLYKYDLLIYNKYIDIMYLPSDEMKGYVDFKGITKALPPGDDAQDESVKRKGEARNKQLELFYVGGVGGDYDISKLLEGVSRCEFLHLTLCCHENQWEQWVQEKGLNVSENITIVHKKGEELEEFYEKADLGILFFTSSGYRKMAMPVKLFEYIGHFLPVVATKGCAAGTFVENNDIGWTINYDTREFMKLLSDLNNNREVLRNKAQKMGKVAKENTWKARALSVYNDLGYKEKGEV